jgi:hypothetical protein
MVLLSGKRKIKDSIQEQIKTKILIPYLKKHEQIKTSDPFYAQMVKVFETIQSEGDLSYQFKTPIQIEPAYEIYHLLFGKKSYDPEKIQIIQDGLSKNYTITKIKSMFTVCQK